MSMINQKLIYGEVEIYLETAFKINNIEIIPKRRSFNWFTETY